MTNTTHFPNNHIEVNNTSTFQTQDWLQCDQVSCTVITAIGIGVGIAIALIMLCLLCKVKAKFEDLENQVNQSSNMESCPIEFIRTSSLPTYEKAVLHDRQETPPPTYYKLFSSIAEQ